MAEPTESIEQATAVPDLPAFAEDISGVTYAMESNPFNTDNIRFVFDPEKSYAELSYTARESWDISYRIGLDNVPRFSDTNNSTFVATGKWTSPDTLVVEVKIVGYSTFDSWAFSFNEDSISVSERSISGNCTYT